MKPFLYSGITNLKLIYGTAFNLHFGWESNIETTWKYERKKDYVCYLIVGICLISFWSLTALSNKRVTVSYEERNRNVYYYLVSSGLLEGQQFRLLSLQWETRLSYLHDLIKFAFRPIALQYSRFNIYCIKAHIVKYSHFAVNHVFQIYCKIVIRSIPVLRIFVSSCSSYWIVSDCLE